MVMTDHQRHRLEEARKPGFGIGLFKGMRVLLKHLFKRNTVIEYPDEKQDLSPRTRGVIALKEENCTVCMLCGRECPDWCIYIDSHKETLPPKREGGRQRKRNVLDRFAIDYALCMYCGICVEVCPYDALFWSREFEYAEYDIRELTHEKEKLADWMATVLPPPPLEPGAEGLPSGGQAAGGAVAPAAPAAAVAEQPAGGAPPSASGAPAGAAEAGPASASRPQVEAPSSAAQAPAPASADQAPAPASADQAPAAPEEVPEPKAEGAPEGRAKAAEVEVGVPQVTVPHEQPHPMALEPVEDPQAVFDQVLKEQLDAGSSPQVAQARAKVARVKAERGIKRGPTPVEVEKPVPSAPTKAEQAAAPPEAEPSGAPEAEEPQPPQGPVAPADEDQERGS
jgi:formate hydrogenlyase subunit 6/NADH:ubiquinone oxidoreductase subunit I